MELSLLTALVRPFFSFVNTSELLIWSVLDKTELNKWDAKTKVTTKFVDVLFCVFLIVSVIMLVNMLVALLTKTYDNITVSSAVARGGGGRGEYSPIMLSTGRLRPKWVPFSGFRYMNGYGFHYK